jgi:uncharacterized protein
MKPILLITFLIFLSSPLHPCDGLVHGKSSSICQQVMDAAAGGDTKKMTAFIKIKYHDVIDDFGRTPLMVAAIFGKIEMVELFIENGADIDATDKKGFTPLMYAAGFKHIFNSYGLWGGMRESQAMFTLKGRVAVFRKLFDMLADYTLTAQDGKTVFDIAREEGINDFSEILAEVNLYDHGKEVLEHLIEYVVEYIEPMRIPNYFNPWEDEWTETPEKIDSGSLIVSDTSLEIGRTQYNIRDFKREDGRKIKGLEIIVKLHGMYDSVLTGMNIALGYKIEFGENAEIFLFEYYSGDKEIRAGLVEADPDKKSVNIYSLNPKPKNKDEFLSGYLYKLSRKYDKKHSEFKMKRSEDGWVFMLKSPDGVEGKRYSGEELDRLWQRKK